MVLELIKEKFEVITKNPDQLKKLISLFGNFNIETSTMGGKVFWNTLIESNGYKLQQNKITGLCRILDDKDHRKAWGTVSSLETVIGELTTNTKESMDEIEKKIDKLIQWKEKGIITEEELQEKKKELMSKI